MKKNMYFTLGVFISLLAVSFMPQAVEAQWSNGWNVGQEQIREQETGLPDTPAIDVITNILMWLLATIFLLTILAFVGSGLMFITSTGNSQIIDKAKDWLTFAIIGLIVSVLGFIIVLTVSNILKGESPPQRTPVTPTTPRAPAPSPPVATYRL